MEKKGEPLNQLAIISDLIEKMNLTIDSTIVNIILNESEFKKMFEIVQKKYKSNQAFPNNLFRLTIGKVEIVFSKSNVETDRIF